MDENLMTLLEEVKRALEGFAKREQFNSRVADNIKELWDDEVSGIFDHSVELIKSGQYDNELQKVGLAGRMLAFKWEVWRIIKESKGKIKILAFINSLLSSLSCIIPGFELVKEFKDMMHIVHQPSDAAPPQHLF